MVSRGQFDYLSLEETARQLKTHRKMIRRLVEQGVIEPIALNAAGGWIFDRGDVIRAKQDLEARYGVPPEGWVTTEQAAAILRVSSSRVYTLRDRLKGAVYGRPGRWYFDPVLLHELADDRETCEHAIVPRSYKRQIAPAMGHTAWLPDQWQKIQVSTLCEMQTDEIDEVLATQREQDWRAAGFEIVDHPLKCVRWHQPVEIVIDCERGWMCGRCMVIYRTGDILPHIAARYVEWRRIKERGNGNG